MSRQTALPSAFLPLADMETALSACEDVHVILQTWLDTIPYGVNAECHKEACRISAVMALLDNAMRPLINLLNRHVAKQEKAP